MVPSRLPIRARLVALIVLVGSTGCGSSGQETHPSDRYSTTIPAFRSIIEPVIGTEGTVQALLRPGISPHTYDPRPSDVRTAREGRALIYGSELLDHWAARLPETRPLGLVGLLPDSLLRPVPGSPPGGDPPDAARADPHFWTDPLAVRALLPALVDTLCTLEPPDCPRYRANAARFTERLDSLHARIADLVRPVRGRPVILAQPFLGFFLRRYGIPIAGVLHTGGGGEPSPRHVDAIIRIARERPVDVILRSSHAPAQTARTVARATGARLVTLDPLGPSEEDASYEAWLIETARTTVEAYP